jgi:hypothetical protein
MVLYECECCIFSSKLKGDYKRHLKTKKHLDNIENNVISMVKSQKEPKKSQKEPKRATKEPQKSQCDSTDEDKFYCEFCFELFTTFANKRRHELHRCKQNNSIIKSKINTLEKDKKELQKTIHKLIDKAGNTTINNIKSTQNNQQNIKLNNYGSEDLSHITDFFKTNLLSLPHGMIPKMIEAVHFNNDKPENKNILLPNKNDNKMKVFSGDKWVYKDKNETINDLMDGKYFIMDTHYETICETTDKKFTLFKRFQALFDERNKMIVETQKKECELLLLNNR